MKSLLAIVPAILIAPWAVVPVIVIGGLGSSDAGIASDIFWGLFFGVVAGVPAAYFGVLLIGVPGYILLRRFGIERGWSLCLVGFVFPLALSWSSVPTPMSLMLGVCGAAVALTGWLSVRYTESSSSN